MKKIHLMLVVLSAFAVVTCTNGVASAYLSTEYVGNTMVDLSWTEYKSTDFSKYELYRDGSWINTIRDRTVAFYRDTGLTKGHTYIYEIRSYYTTDKYGSDTTSATTGEVHGTITQDTTWTAASSPYMLTGNVLRIYDGATLTIADGVLVSSNNIPQYRSDISVHEKGALNADGSRFCNVTISVYDSHADIKNCFFEYKRTIRLDNSNDSTITNNTDCGYVIVSHSSNNTITGNTARRIQLTSSNNNDIRNNTVSNNPKDYGIYLSRSSDNVITSNTVSNSSLYGIYLQFSSNNAIAGNEVLNNQKYGISLRSSSNNAITGNNVSDNRLRGISLSCSSDNNIITGNTASNNEGGGIYLFYDPIRDSTANNSNNTITNNTVSNNSKSGISLYSSSDNNLIYNNYFNNTNNSYDNGNNTWNITKTTGTNIVGGPYLGGNYWSDYDGTDLDGDRLGDTLIPYNCSGGIQNGGDWHPLIEIEKIILKTSKDGYASVKQEVDNDENFERIEISGNVTDKSTGEPIENAEVEIVKGAEQASTTTSADGTYTITAIIPEGSGSDTREDINFELTPSQYVVGVYEITPEAAQLIEENNGTITDQMDYGEGHRAYLVEISKEENIDPFLNNVTKSPLVEYVEFNYLAEPEYEPKDLRYHLQWGPRNIRAGGPQNPSAWDLEKGDKDITIAIIDTGIQYDHIDLYRFNDGTIKYVHGYDWIDIDNNPYPARIGEDHGTHCAGIATAVMDNYEGIAGIAPNCSFIAERVLGPGASAWTIARGIHDAVNHNADIISMSLSYGWNSHPLVERACERAWLSDCILVAASGNQYGGMIWPWFFTTPRIRYPAAHPHVIAVGNIQPDNSKRPSSNWGPRLELVAPGTNIHSTLPDNKYTNMTGTSMAAPHVSGLAALLKSRAERWPPEPQAINPQYHLNNNQIREVLIQSAVDLGPPGWDIEYGWGKVDAALAVRCVNISGNVLESVLYAPISGVEVRVTSIEGPPGVYSTNENTALARITPEGDYYIRVPPGVYSICAMAFGYIPSRELGGERLGLPAFDLTGQLTTEHWDLRLLPLPGTVFGNVTDSITGLPINKAHVSLDGPPHIYPPHPNVRIKTETNASGKYRFILTYDVHPGGLYNISVGKSGYLTKTQNFTLNWSNVITDYYKCPLSPRDYNPPIVNFSLLSVPSELPDLTLARDGIQVIFNENIATISATIHNIGTADASNIVVQFFDGDPDAGGTQIGSDQIIRSIAHESSGTAQMTWIAVPGTHDFFVRVDPYSTIQEAKENNNQAYKQITVSGAKTLYVDDDFTDDPANHRWDTIQEGITDANDGDTVLVYNGTYTETVVLNKRVTLTGEGMPEIDAHGAGDAINITADNCTVKGFNCVNAQPSPYAGIHVESRNNFIVENTCRNNYDGIYLSGSSNEIRNNIADYNDHHGIKLRVSSENIIANNTARNNGNNGIYLTSSDNNRITGNDASNNDNYNGISLSTSNNNEIRSNLANDNHQTGIGLWSLNENIIANNTAKNNANNGVYLEESKNNKIANNIANSNKRGIRLYNYSTDNIVANNTATANSYGISVVRSSNNNIYLNNFVDNTNNAYSSNSSNIWRSASK